jgi:hypothetical protein
MKQTLKLFAGIFLVFTSLSLYSQPQYYNYQNVGTSSNSFPFNQAAGKASNWLFLPGAFNQPSALPPGQMITRVYFYISSGGTRSFTNLHILMAQDNITDLTSGAFYSGTFDTVFAKDTSLTAATNAWVAVNLETPYPYDPTKSLIVFVGQCGATGSGLSVRQNVLTGIKRVWSIGGCPLLPFAGGDASTVNFGVDVVPAPAGPNYLHYKFENNPSPTSVLNCGNPGAGTPIATMTGLTLSTGGQFDSCIVGTGVNGAGVVTGWNNNLGSSSWTISMWIEATTTTFGYIFGDGGGSFRCFNNGAAGTNAITLRGTGITNVDVTGFASGPVVVHFVYDSALANIKVYKDGVLFSTVAQTPLNLTPGTGFKVGGYTTVAGFTGKMDEFRLYRRALGAGEIASTWNQDVACGILVPVTSTNSETPVVYSLEQNYPNPFNPVTSIRFSVPKTGLVGLKVYDALGREVEVLVNEQLTSGRYEIKFDASKLASGIYFYTLETQDFKGKKIK